MVSLTQAPSTGPKIVEECGPFEGPEKTLTLCFKQRRVSTCSLRHIAEEQWAEVLRHARCEILSGIESTPVNPLQLRKGGKNKRVSTKGLTGYLLSESSLFLSDTTLTLKTCGRTTPLAALEPILTAVVPTWRQKCVDEYLSYASFSRLGYMFPDEQVSPHTSWSEEVSYLDKFFKGESLVLGSEVGSKHHMYVANYMPQGEIFDAFSTQVALTELDTGESLANFSEGASGGSPLRTAWKELHGDEPRSVAVNPMIDERFFKPVGYSGNAVFGRYFTTVHATPQPGCSYISIETSMPMTREGLKHFVTGAERFCCASKVTVTEFALCPALFSRPDQLAIPGFKLQRSSQSVGPNFACALHHFERDIRHLQRPPVGLPQPPAAAETTTSVEAWASAAETREGTARPPVVEVEEYSLAAVRAAQLFLAAAGQEPKEDLPLALVDLGEVRRRAEVWRQHLPQVEPFYAVKCNGHPALLRALWSVWQEWGTGGFDCASPPEMAMVTALGADLGKHTVYANPCKQESAIVFARTAGVRRVVFDNEAELLKLQRLHPNAELLLRVQTDDAQSKCPLSNKFGAKVDDSGALLAKAKELCLSVVGVSFHVGSLCTQVGAFRNALVRARAVFDEMERHGFIPTLLDIGGGFPGGEEEGQASFADHAEDIRAMLGELFPSPSVRVIAEPGRFFAATAQAVLTTVVSVAETAEGCRYYLNDGVYGSFNCLIHDHATVPRPLVLRDGEELPQEELAQRSPCTLFGPTCDGIDVLTESMALPRLRVGDRLVFPNMGAYTTAASSSFNGFTPAAGFVFESRLVASGEDG